MCDEFSLQEMRGMSYLLSFCALLCKIRKVFAYCTLLFYIIFKSAPNESVAI